MNKQLAFLFPGQGAQYVGMGKDFFQEFSVVRHTLEEACDVLNRDLTHMILEGPEERLTETANSQLAIYTISIALLRVLQHTAPSLQPALTAGLSLGEYTALTSAGYLSFLHGLKLVQARAQAMTKACQAHPGTMSVVLGLKDHEVEAILKEQGLKDQIWAANFNCPEQVVISGTLEGVEHVSALLIQRGAKRILPLKVQGAFHSGLMQPAVTLLQEAIAQTPFENSFIPVAMNVTGKLTNDIATIKQLLVEQVVSSVRWEASIRTLEQQGVHTYLEIGCGKTLSGFNKRIGAQAPTISIEKVTDLANLENLFKV